MWELKTREFINACRNARSLRFRFPLLLPALNQNWKVWTYSSKSTHHRVQWK